MPLKAALLIKKLVFKYCSIQGSSLPTYLVCRNTRPTHLLFYLLGPEKYNALPHTLAHLDSTMLHMTGHFNLLLIIFPRDMAM